MAEPASDPTCEFCGIVSGRLPRTVRHEDDELIVFHNTLTWVPVMYLVAPKKHMSQEELWRDIGRVGEVAIQLGQELCPSGYRLVSNIGDDGMQSQQHGHVHVLGGRRLGRYIDQSSV